MCSYLTHPVSDFAVIVWGENSSLTHFLAEAYLILTHLEETDAHLRFCFGLA